MRLKLHNPNQIEEQRVAEESPAAAVEQSPAAEAVGAVETAEAVEGGESLPGGVAAEAVAPAAEVAEVIEVPIATGWKEVADPHGADTSETKAEAPATSKPAYMIAHEQHLEELKDEFVCAAQRRSDLEADLKAAKIEEKNALKLYTQTLLRGAVKPSDGTAKSSTPSGDQSATTPGGQGEAQAASASDPSSPASPDAQQSDAWRSASINELTELSEKLRDKLAEAANGSTIGDLENLRAKIAEGKASWPKGVGEAKQTQVEDAIIRWLTANRDSYAFSSGGKSEMAGEAQATETADVAQNSEDWIDAEKWNMLPAAEKSAYIYARYRELRGDDGNADWAKPKIQDGGYFDDGELAFWLATEPPEGGGDTWDGKFATLQVERCQWHPCDAQDDWIRGFFAGYESYLASEDGGPAKAGDAPEPSEPVAAPAAIASPVLSAPAWTEGF